MTHKNKKFKLLLRREGCRICDRWTALRGCHHHGPQDSDLNKDLVKEIVKRVHGGNPEIIETSDFTEGINATLIFLRKNGLLKK